MRILRSKIVVSVLAGVGAVLANTPSHAASGEITCAKRSIGSAVALLKPGDTLLVRGACVENLAIPGHIHGITLNGQGAASIAPLDSAQPTINIQGRGITIIGFTITGGSAGIFVSRGGTVVLDGNLIRDAQTGVNVTRNSTARLINNTIQNSVGSGVAATESAAIRLDNNTIQNNGLDGVLINENSAARIGLEAANTVRENARGIVITRSSNARITGNSITNNSSRGIDVLRGSHADVANNTISDNAGHGILVNYNSAVNMDNANSGFNNQFGIVCLNGGMVDGRRGSLNGASGATSFLNGCVDNTVP